MCTKIPINATTNSRAMCGRISRFLAADLRCHVSHTKNERFRLMKICGLWSFNPRPKPSLGGVRFFSNDVLGEGFGILMGLSLLARATWVPPGGGGAFVSPSKAFKGKRSGTIQEERNYSGCG